MKKNNYLLVGLTIASAIFAFYPRIVSLYRLEAKNTCETSSQFKNDTGPADASSGNTINQSGTVKYFWDDFSQYSQNSKLIEQFDDLNNFSFKGAYADKKLSTERISGKSSLSLKLVADNHPDTLSVRKNLDQPLDLSRWNDSGILSMWIKIENRKGIPAVGLKIGDNKNNYRTYQDIKNLQLDIPNNYDSDDVYPDVTLATGNAAPATWTDFWLNRGWNYLFWKIDRSHYTDSGKVAMENIAWFEITLQEDNNLASQEILIDNFRIANGLQRGVNSLGDNWYPPENEPQNGIFDLDKTGPSEYTAKLMSVSETQYPSNGNHGRMVLNYGTPLNFALRTKFMLTNFPDSPKEKVNTWFRVAYDFDSAYDVGHDWFGTFISFEWNKFGLTTVIPLEKDNIQTWEPRSEKTLGSSVNFTPKENVLYEIHLTVRGQNATASIYEVGSDCLILKGSTNYTFQRARHGEDKRYPFCLEVTGNVKAYLYEVEIKEL